MIIVHRTTWIAGLLAAAATLPGLAAPAPARTAGDKEQGEYPNLPPHGSASVFLSGGDLGTVPLSTVTLIQQQPTQVKVSAATTLLDLLQFNVGLTGQETILPIAAQPIQVDKQQRAHIRYRQFFDGLPLEGATLSIHFDTRTGHVLAANGEVHRSDSVVNGALAESAALDCAAAMEAALEDYKSESSLATSSDGGGEWQDDCRLAAVQGRDGNAYLAYKRLYGHQPETKQTLTANGDGSGRLLVESEPYRLDVLFADRTTGALVAVHPTVFGSRTMTTYDCNLVEVNGPADCTVVTNSPTYIGTNDDPPLDDAHNNTIDVYDFYLQHFGRKSFDGNDLKIQTLAHYGFAYNNAFFSSAFGCYIAYGDGDGFQFSHWGHFDVVAHEFSHGVTYFTSNLIYIFESGAMNEAFSDVMGATADRLVKRKSPADVWRIGEDVDRLFGVGIRDMADPPDFGDPDYFANRYTGYDDNGGVHTNSGIMNKAFFLMVEGGTHPVSGIVVNPLDADFDRSIKQAATIFYNANTMCLTESSSFITMRECTLLFARPEQKSTVRNAWEAVGVKGFIPLTAGVAKVGISLPYDYDVQVFQLDRTVGPHDIVTCTLRGTNGDPDLSVRFGHPPILYPYSFVGNDCVSASESATETCTTGYAPGANMKVYVAVEAYRASTNAELLCTVSSPSTQAPSPFAVLPPTKPPTKKPTRAPTKPPTKKPTRAPTKSPTKKPTGPTCKALRVRCTSRTQCCRYTTATTCDGAQASSRICKACKVRRTGCTRSTECCLNLSCRNRRCV